MSCATFPLASAVSAEQLEESGQGGPSPVSQAMTDFEKIIELERKAIGDPERAPIFINSNGKFLFPGKDPLTLSLVNAADGSRRQLTEGAKLRAALQAQGFDAENFRAIDLIEAQTVLVLADSERVVTYAVGTDQVSLSAEYNATLTTRKPRQIRTTLPTTFGPLMESASPDGQQFVTLKEGDLYLREARADRLIRLTDDAETDFNWYNVEEAGPNFNVVWNAAGTRIAAIKLDQRGVPQEPLIRWNSRQPQVDRYYYSRAGDPIPRAELWVFDLTTNTRRKISVAETENRYLTIAGWSADGRFVYYQLADRDNKRIRFYRGDAETGASTLVITETSSTYIDTPFTLGPELFTPLRTQPGFLLWSERSGTRQLYRYTETGKLMGRISDGVSVHSHIVRIDESKGRVYVMASTSPVRPYDIQLVVMSLDPGYIDPEVLTSGKGVNRVWMAPSAEYFVSKQMTDTLPPIWTLYDRDGTSIAELARADVEPLRALGFVKPENFTTSSEDGASTVNGTIFKPFGFDPARRYPIIEYIYGGMQVAHVPRGHYGWNRLSGDSGEIALRYLLHKGFVVVVIDAPGTPGQGRSYQDAVYGMWPQTVIPNHAKWLQEMARSRPWMDVGRTGIYGYSWGGYMSVRAILEKPELYKAAVSVHAPQDLNDHPSYIEPFMGMPTDNPDGYRLASNLRMIEALDSPLLLISAPLDVNAGYSPSMKFIEAAVSARKNVQFFTIPDITHDRRSGSREKELYLQALVVNFLKDNLIDPARK